MKHRVLAIVSAALIATASLITAPAVSAAQPAKKLTSNDRQYIALVRDSAPELRYVKPKQLVKSAKVTCRTLRSGYTILDVYDIGIESGLGSTATTALIAGAIVFYCPEQEDNY